MKGQGKYTAILVKDRRLPTQEKTCSQGPEYLDSEGMLLTGAYQQHTQVVWGFASERSFQPTVCTPWVPLGSATPTAPQRTCQTCLREGKGTTHSSPSQQQQRLHQPRVGSADEGTSCQA